MTTGCGILCTIVYVSRWRCHSRGRKLPKIQRQSLWLQRYAVSGLLKQGLSYRVCFCLRSARHFCFTLMYDVVYRMLAVFLNGLNGKNSSRSIVRNIFSVYFFYSGFKISYSEYSFVTQIVISGTAEGEGLVGPRLHHFFAPPPPLFTLKRKMIKIKKRTWNKFFPSIFRYILCIFFNFKR